MILKELKKADLLHLNGYNFIVDNAIFVALTGSVAYGASTDVSDVDVFGITIPPAYMVYPQKFGEITGFTYSHLPKFDEFQQHHIKYMENMYDLKIYSIIKFFQLAVQGNPNIIDSFFTPANHVIYIHPIMQRIMMKREDFLSKECYHRFRGFAYNHFKSMSHLKVGREHYCKYGYDVKDASHLIRQLLGLIEILDTGNYTLNKNAEEIIAIRKGKYTYNEIKNYGEELLYEAEIKLVKSELKDKPDYESIKNLLADSINQFYDLK